MLKNTKPLYKHIEIVHASLLSSSVTTTVVVLLTIHDVPECMYCSVQTLTSLNGVQSLGTAMLISLLELLAHSSDGH